MASDERAFEEALVALGGLINQRKRADGSNWGDAFALMNEYVRVLGLEEAVANPSLIHVAGTKGKGSTCAFTESILRASGHTTGLFTSPHLVDVRERFRINGELVAIPVFLENFWWCYNTCKEACARDPSIPMPAYFRFLTLLALRLFSQLKVDVVLLEVGIGGRYDATNVVKQPAVCGISTLGFDHMELLGDTLGLIAGEKAGIFKPGVPAVTSPQEDEALLVLQQRAADLQIPLTVLAPCEGVPESARLGLSGRHQRVNAALAVALATRWAQRTGRHQEAEAVQEAMARGKLPPAYLAGLRDASWPGRCQVIRDVPFPADVIGPAGSGGGAPAREGAAEQRLSSPARDPTTKDAASTNGDANGSGCAAVEEGVGGERGPGEDSRQLPAVSFYLDGAHTPESMEVCADWFCDELQSLPGRQRQAEGGRDIKTERGREGIRGTTAEETSGAAPVPSPGLRPPQENARGGASSGGAADREYDTGPRDSRKVLLFNCMPERDPEVLFRRLLASLAQRGVSMDSAIFVPPLSSYSSLVTSLGHTPAPLDLSWQQGLKETWDRLHRETVTASVLGVPEGGAASGTPAGGTLAGGTPAGGATAGGTPGGGVPGAASGAPEGLVAPSLPAALRLLWFQGTGARRDVKVLVTGSLHLVGDVLRILQRHR